MPTLPLRAGRRGCSLSPPAPRAPSVTATSWLTAVVGQLSTSVIGWRSWKGRKLLSFIKNVKIFKKNFDHGFEKNVGATCEKGWIQHCLQRNVDNIGEK
jgi:hypothetical protein